MHNKEIATDAFSVDHLTAAERAEFQRETKEVLDKMLEFVNAFRRTYEELSQSGLFGLAPNFERAFGDTGLAMATVGGSLGAGVSAIFAMTRIGDKFLSNARTQLSFKVLQVAFPDFKLEVLEAHRAAIAAKSAHEAKWQPRMCVNHRN